MFWFRWDLIWWLKCCLFGLRLLRLWIMLVLSSCLLICLCVVMVLVRFSVGIWFICRVGRMFIKGGMR